MKKFKKLVSVLLAVVMVLAMSVPSFAEGTGSVVIDNAIDEKTYTIYKIANLESYSGNSYSYKVESAWVDFIKNYKVVSGESTRGITVDKDNYIIANTLTDVDGPSFAKAALAYAASNSISGTSLTANKSAVTFTGLDSGYYLVDSSTGTLCSLDTLKDATVTIHEKNAAPTITKTSVNNASIDEEIEYTVTIIAQPGAQNYVFHDEMGEGLTFSGKGSVSVEGATENDYVISDNVEGHSFDIEFGENFLNSITEATTITINYKAKLNANAVIDGDGNVNTAYLNYGENHTASASNAVKTYGFDLVKTTTSDDVLSGAEFELFNGNGADAQKIQLVLTDNGNYRVATTDEKTNDQIKKVTIVAGHVSIIGLGNGTYYLEETKAPAGYNKLTSRQAVTVSDSTNEARVENDKWISGGAHVINNTGTVLPSTGGIGTTVFYAAGIVLMAGAVFFVVRKKRG